MALFQLFEFDRFMPHGHCYQWDPGILWTSVISDALIAIAYMAIPFTLVFQIKNKRTDLPFNWMFACFGLFIVACGATHVMEIITIWTPLYALSDVIKVITAAASVPTAIILFKIAPKIVKFPSVQQMAEEHTRRMQAEDANKIRDRFIAGVSHELRTPLTPVRAGVDLIEQELRQAGPVAPQIEETLRMIRGNLALETVLIDDLLLHSDAVRGQKQLQLGPVDVRRILDETISRFRAELANRKIHFACEIRAERTVVRGAAVRLQQILNHLLDNAIKFTPEGGDITIVVTNAGANLELIVRDSGSGIEPGELEKIFLPFEQLNRTGAQAREGVGLGLTVARAMTEAQNGRLTAASDGLGRGSRFTLTLPLTDEAVPAVTDVATASAAETRKPRLLVVDDHQDTLRAISTLLRRVGYTVATAATMKAAEDQLGDCEILVSDIGLPDGSGWDLMETFRARGGKAGIAISGFGQKDDIRRSAEAGFSKHLIKPIEMPTLIKALQTAEATVE